MPVSYRMPKPKLETKKVLKINSNFSIKECVQHSVFLVFPYFPFHFSYHLMHRSQSKNARLRIWGKQRVFFVLFFFAALPMSRVAALTCLNCFRRGGSVCAAMQGWSHALATNQGCSPQTKTFLFPLETVLL